MSNYFEKSELSPPPLKDLADKLMNRFYLHRDPRNGVPGTPIINWETGEYIGRWASQKRADEVYRLHGDML